MKKTFVTLKGGSLRIRFACAMMMAAFFFQVQNVSAMPRMPLPPVPETSPIWHESFDEDYFLGETNSFLTISGFGMLDQSWSGYALARSSETVVPYIVPAVDATGHTNISSDTGGALRFWVRPYWSSQSVTNGTGPGTNAVLLEFDMASGGESAFVWSLQTSPDGNTLSLVTQTSDGVQDAIESEIVWQEGVSHCVTLDFNSQGTTLFLDGAPLAQGGGLPSIPCSVGELVIGGTLSGANPAQADIDEMCSFDTLLTNSDAANYYMFTGTQAQKGPMSWQEGQWNEQGGEGLQMDSIRTPGNVFDPNNATPCSPGGPFCITNVIATPQTNGNTTVSFDICIMVFGPLANLLASPHGILLKLFNIRLLGTHLSNIELLKYSMNYIKLVLIMLVALLPNPAQSQGTFQNLDFEDANPVIVPNSPYYPYGVTAASALPDWTVTLGGVQQTQITENDPSTGSTWVSIVSGGPGAIDGNYSVLLQGGLTASDASISQTGTIPATAESLLFEEQSLQYDVPVTAGSILIYIGNESIPIYEVSSGPNYNVFGCDISAWAGQTEQLTLSAPNDGGGNNWILDDISFSSTAVPEPNAAFLLGIAGLIFAFYLKWKMQRE